MLALQAQRFGSGPHKPIRKKLGMVGNAFNLSPEEAKTGGYSPHPVFAGWLGSLGHLANSRSVKDTASKTNR